MSAEEPSSERTRADAQRVLSLIDLTSLGENDRPETVDALCDEAVTPYGPVAAVCIWPRFVARAVERLSGTGLGVAAVANFPDGADDRALAVADAEAIVEAGGVEVDVVFPWRSLAAGQADVGRRLVEVTRNALGDGIVLKVILETGELVEPELIRRAATESLDAGADFLKTSTGKTQRSATPEAARLLLEVIRDRDATAGVKVSGGVRTTAQALDYLSIADEVMGPAWVTPSTFRYGASSLLGDVVATLRGSEAGAER
ncbi:MAG: deoxyribose-phosphate aldolase [Acidimicrobiales bacterium]